MNIWNCKNQRDHKVRKKRVDEVNKTLYIEFEIDHVIFYCFILRFFFIEFFLFFTNFNKLINDLGIKSCNWKKNENGKKLSYCGILPKYFNIFCNCKYKLKG